MTSLLERARAMGGPGGSLCAIQKVKAALPALVDEIDALLAANDVPHTVAARVINESLKDSSITLRVSDGVIGHHRAGRCTRCL